MMRKVVGLFKARGSSLYGQIFRYLISGGSAFCIDFGIMVLLKEFIGMEASVAACIGNFSGLVVTYLLSVFWIFDHRRCSNRYVEFLVFFLIGLSGTGLTYLLMYFFVDNCGIHYMLAKIITVVSVTAWNFVAKKRLLF